MSKYREEGFEREELVRWKESFVILFMLQEEYEEHLRMRLMASVGYKSYDTTMIELPDESGNDMRNGQSMSSDECYRTVNEETIGGVLVQEQCLMQ